MVLKNQTVSADIFVVKLADVVHPLVCFEIRLVVNLIFFSIALVFHHFSIFCAFEPWWHYISGY